MTNDDTSAERRAAAAVSADTKMTVMLAFDDYLYVLADRIAASERYADPGAAAHWQRMAEEVIAAQRELSGAGHAEGLRGLFHIALSAQRNSHETR